MKKNGKEREGGKEGGREGGRKGGGMARTHASVCVDFYMSRWLVENPLGQILLVRTAEPAM